MHAPRLGQEQPPFLRQRLGTAEHVLERGDRDAVRMAALRGCSSCCGSPSRTRLVAACATARALASDICPASSTKSTSAMRPASSRAQSHAVPPTTSASPSRSASSAASFSGLLTERRSGIHVVLADLLGDAHRLLPFGRRGEDSVEQVAMTLWLGPMTPTFFPRPRARRSSAPRGRSFRSRAGLESRSTAVDRAHAASRLARPSRVSPAFASHGSPAKQWRSALSRRSRATRFAPGAVRRRCRATPRPARISASASTRPSTGCARTPPTDASSAAREAFLTSIVHAYAVHRDDGAELGPSRCFSFPSRRISISCGGNPSDRLPLPRFVTRARARRRRGHARLASLSSISPQSGSRQSPKNSHQPALSSRRWKSKQIRDQPSPCSGVLVGRSSTTPPRSRAAAPRARSCARSAPATAPRAAAGPRDVCSRDRRRPHLLEPVAQAGRQRRSRPGCSSRLARTSFGSQILTR